MIDRLAHLLLQIKTHRPKKFSGLGVVLYENLEHLPVSPLREGEYLTDMPIKNFDLIFQYLVEISSADNIWHDGFHLISSDFHLTHFSQYFSTPIVDSATIDFAYGSRHRTALYGSYLKDVLACGVVSSDFNAVIFHKGYKQIIDGSRPL